MCNHEIEDITNARIDMTANTNSLVIQHGIISTTSNYERNDLMKHQPTHEELKEAAKPLLDILYKYYSPMYKIILDMGHIEVVDSDMGAPIKIRD